MKKNYLIPKTLKGFRDFLPEDQILRETVIEKIKKIFQSYGFDPIETPALEYEETLLNKYGEENNKLLYLFQDKGKRRIGLRYDQTVPLARLAAQYQNLVKPFKRYQIQPVWRAENPQKGRYREFYQCDIDIVGSESFFADVEIIILTLTVLKKLGFKNIKMLINDREIFKNISSTLIVSIDKLEKIGQEEVIKELINKGLTETQAKQLLTSLKKSKPTETLKKIFQELKKSGFQENKDYIFSPTLARGLDYYTSTIFEVVTNNYQVGSLGGGGRYDQLIGQFTGQDIPAVGFAFGFDRIIEAIKSLNLIKIKKTNTQVLVTIFSQKLFNQSLTITNLLRKNNINTEIYLNSQAKLEKQLKYADKKGIPYVIIIGPEEKEKNLVKIKNMKTGEQKEVQINKLLDYLNSR